MKKYKMCIGLVLLMFVGAGCSSLIFNYKMAESPNGEEGLSFYRSPAGSKTLKPISGDEVRNIIFCIGDGMGFNHVALAQDASGAKQLWMQTLPVSGQVTTYSANERVTDSAASGTALACGVKTNNGMIGMTPQKVQYQSILELLMQDGYKSGLVATSQITHATPASFASHVKARGDQKGIAPQMLDNRVDVMLAGGRKYWLPKAADGIRTDDLDLLAKARSEGYQVIETRDELLALKQTPVLGLFGKDGLTTFDPEPSLAEMSSAAIKLLSDASKKDPGFFLMIEGSQIDWAAHANDTDRVIRQTLLFDMAVREAIEFARGDKHTLVIVTADHETGGLKLKPKADGAGGVKANWTSGGHTAANVPIYAFGPGAEKFAGTLDNTDIPKRIADLTGISPFPVKRTK